MSDVAERKRERAKLLPDLFSWVEGGIPGWPIGPGLHAIKIEERIADGTYVIDAELPGIDPDKDLEITVSGDALTLRAEREEETKDKYRSEFRYGVLTRTVRLPAGARGDEAVAECKDGVLTVKVPLAEPKEGTRTVPVRHG